MKLIASESISCCTLEHETDRVDLLNENAAGAKAYYKLSFFNVYSSISTFFYQLLK